MSFSVKEFHELTAGELYDVLSAREEIFKLEKGMDCRDLDGADKSALHCILSSNEGRLIGYVRAIPAGGNAIKIGRVLTLTHGCGHGRELLLLVEEHFRLAGFKAILVHAQHDAVGFYTKMGFTLTSDEFIEAGVRHFSMEKNLTDKSF